MAQNLKNNLDANFYYLDDGNDGVSSINQIQNQEGSELALKNVEASKKIITNEHNDLE